MGEERLPRTGSLLALDISKRRIGVAGTDPAQRLVTPLATIVRKGAEADRRALARFIEERSVVAVIVGLPLNMDGTEGPAARSVRDTAAMLLRDLGLPCCWQDERLTTEAVKQAILEGRLARPRRNEPLDHYAAAVILEDALRRLER